MTTIKEALSVAAAAVRIIKDSEHSYIINGPHDALKPRGATTHAGRAGFISAKKCAASWKAYIACRQLGMDETAARETERRVMECYFCTHWRDEVRMAYRQHKAAA